MLFSCHFQILLAISLLEIAWKWLLWNKLKFTKEQEMFANWTTDGVQHWFNKNWLASQDIGFLRNTKDLLNYKTRLKNFLILTLHSTNAPKNVQGVKAESGKSLSSKFGRNQCLYWNKRYFSKKPLISALIWHPKSGRGLIMRFSRTPALK